jgi:hypothetical protein
MHTIKTGRQRDLRIDFFRGLALIFIFIDHIPDNRLANLTLRNFAFADAAELFVLLAGFSAVLAYGRTFETEGFQAGVKRTLHRAGQIYVWHIGLLLLCGFGLAAIATAVANPMYVEAIKLNMFADQPVHALASAATLINQPNLLNILPLYVMLLLVWAPLLLWMVSRAPFVALGLSIGLWAAANVFSLNLPAQQNPAGWVFNPFAWQVLMTIGAVTAHFSLRRPIPVIPWLVIAAGAYAVFAFLFMAPWALIPGLENTRLIAPDALGSLDRIYVPAWRLVSILALGYLALVLISARSRWLTEPWAVAVANCGRHSLQIFCLATVLSLGAWVFLTEIAGNGLAPQLVVNFVGIALMLATAALLTQRKAAPESAAARPRHTLVQARAEPLTSPRP